MGTLYLVRHGQASLGAHDYDQLSALGAQQSERLGAYFVQQGLRFDTVLTGTLKRHAQTWAGVAQGGGYSATAQVWPGLDEYDALAVIRTVTSGPMEPPASPEAVRHYFRCLREGLTGWMEGRLHPAGMVPYATFRAGVVAVLDHVRAHCSGDVLVVSSGGPISTAVGCVLETSPAACVELNMRLRNSAVSELVFTPKRVALQTFNTLPHLSGPEFAPWQTYA